MERAGNAGPHSATIDVDWWNEATANYAPIQAWEAAQIHEGNFNYFVPAIRERLESGARVTAEELDSLRDRHSEFRIRMDELFAEHEC